MKFLKSNICSIAMMTLLFSFVMMGDAAALDTSTSNVFGAMANKLVQLFKNSKMIIFVLGGFGLIALAFQAIFGKVKWTWFACLAFGLAVVAAAGAIVNYAANTDNATSTAFSDTLGTGRGGTMNSY